MADDRNKNPINPDLADEPTKEDLGETDQSKRGTPPAKGQAGASTPNSNTTPSRAPTFAPTPTAGPGRPGSSTTASPKKGVDLGGVPSTPLSNESAAAPTKSSTRSPRDSSPHSGASNQTKSPAKTSGGASNQTGTPSDQSPGAFNPAAVKPPLDQSGPQDPSVLDQAMEPDENDEDDRRPDRRRDREEKDDEKPDDKEKDGKDKGKDGEEGQGKSGKGEKGSPKGGGKPGGTPAPKAGPAGATGGRAAAAGGEAAAKQAASQAAKQAAMALVRSPYGLIAIAIALVIILIVMIIVVVIMGLSGATKDTTGSESAGSAAGGEIAGIADISDIEIKPAPCASGTAAGGCFHLPDSKYWSKYGSSGHTGSKCLVQLIAATSKAWKQKYPDDPIVVGAMNEPGHLSHSIGNDVDIHSTKHAANMTLPGYSAGKSTEYGKLWFSTNDIEYIFFNHSTVRGQVNSYKLKNKVAGVIQPWPEGAGDGQPNHEDHFHVRVQLAPDGSCARKPKGSA